MKSLTPAAKRQITQDWLQQFPDLGAYRPLHLLRRMGPLLQGVLLERDSSNASYRPTFHVHCMLQPFPNVTLALEHMLRTERTGAPDTIPVLHHAAKYLEAAARLRKQAPLPLNGDVKLVEVVAAYRAHARRGGTHYDADVLYEDAARLCAWCGDQQQASALIDEGVQALAAWPAQMLERIGGAESWRARAGEAVSDQSGLRATAEEQARALRVTALPQAKLDG